MKKTKYFLLAAMLAVVWLLLPTACNKDHSCERDCPLTGRVLEYGTEKPIPGAKVQLKEYFSDGILNGGSFETIEEVTADSVGKYQCTQSGTVVNATKDLYFSDDNTQEGISNVGNEPIDIHLYPYAWLKVVYRNVSGAYLVTRPSLTTTGLGLEFYMEKGDDVDFLMLRKGNLPFLYGFSSDIDSTGTSLPKNDIHVVDEFGEQYLPDPDQIATVFHITPIGHDTLTLTFTF